MGVNRQPVPQVIGFMLLVGVETDTATRHAGQIGSA